MDVAREQMAIISDYKEDMLVTFTKHDVNLLLNCLFVFRQLLMLPAPPEPKTCIPQIQTTGSKKCRPLIQKFSEEVLKGVLSNLNNIKRQK